MKTRKHSTRKIIPYSRSKSYPNAADKRYYLEKAVDYALTAATGIGTVTIFLFFLTFA